MSIPNFGGTMVNE